MKDADQHGQMKAYQRHHWQPPFNPYLFTDHSYDVRVALIEGAKPEYLEENPQSTAETNYNSTDMTPKLESQHVVTIKRSGIQLLATADQA